MVSRALFCAFDFSFFFFNITFFFPLMSCVNEWSMECEPFPLREFNDGMPNGRYIRSDHG